MRVKVVGDFANRVMHKPYPAALFTVKLGHNHEFQVTRAIFTKLYKNKENKKRKERLGFS
jgi:hypothetical protein